MRTNIIAEIGYNHQGNIDLAKQMICEAEKLNLWAVKFQKWDIDNMPSAIKSKKRTDKNAFGDTYYEHRKALEFSIEQLKELKDYSESKGLEFVCSGKDFESVKQLVEMGCKHIKLPSQRYLDNDIFKYLCSEREKRGFQVIVSTGMYYTNEILSSKWVDKADVIMHCVSLYPAPINCCDFGYLRVMPFYNGYSSHEKDGKAIKYAVCMGAEYIERHFTIDKTMKGTDHAISSDVREMKKIIRDIKEAEKIYGNGYRNLSNEEIEVRNFYRSF